MSEKHSRVPFSKAEAELVSRYAKREGITEDEAATQLFQTELARRIKKRTGKGPARVYPIRGRK